MNFSPHPLWQTYRQINITCTYKDVSSVPSFNFIHFKEKFCFLDNFYVTLNFILIPDKSVVHKDNGSPVFSTKMMLVFYSFISLKLFLFLSIMIRYFIHVSLWWYTQIFWISFVILESNKRNHKSPSSNKHHNKPGDWLKSPMYPSTQVGLILGSILSVYLSTHLCRMQRPRAWFSARKAWISYHSDPDKSPRDNRYMLLYSCLYFTFTTRKYQVITFLLFNAI